MGQGQIIFLGLASPRSINRLGGCVSWIRDSDVKGAFMGRGEDWLSSNDEIYSFGGKIEAPVWG